MFDCSNLVVNIEPQSTSCSKLQQFRAEKRPLDEGESRVSTDSDLDLESEDEDDYRSTFSDLLMRRLIAVELAQQQQILREEKFAKSSPMQFMAPDDSYRAKMRRVSQWRLSTAHSSEAQSETPSETASDNSSPAPASRKRRLSGAYLPSAPKRARVMAPSPAPPGSPFLSHPRAYAPDESEEKPSWMGAYTQTYIIHAELRVRPYSRLNAHHVCTACDTSFVTRQRLRRHGRGAWTPDACRAAVTYELE